MHLLIPIIILCIEETWLKGTNPTIIIRMICAMQKTPLLFDQENEVRKKIEFSTRKLPEVKIWQMWWYYVWVNIGQEMSKNNPYQRPCLIFREIPESSLLMVAPLSTKLHKQRKNTSLKIKNPRIYWLKKSWILLHQLQIIDKKRLQNKIEGKIFGKRFIRLLNHKMFS